MLPWIRPQPTKFSRPWNLNFFFLYTWHLLLRWQIRLRISFFYFATPTCFFPSTVYYSICFSSTVKKFRVEKKKMILSMWKTYIYFRIHLLESISFFALFFECILLLMVYYHEYLTADPFIEWGNDKKFPGSPLCFRICQWGIVLDKLVKWQVFSKKWVNILMRIKF